MTIRQMLFVVLFAIAVAAPQIYADRHRPMPIEFYQEEPDCPERQKINLLYPVGPFGMGENRIQVWSCGVRIQR